MTPAPARLAALFITIASATTQAAPPTDAPGRFTPDWTGGGFSTCGDGSFTGHFPDVDADACTDGRYPSSTAVDALALCDDGVVAVCDGVAFPSLAAGAMHCSGSVLAVCPGTHRIDDPVMVPADGPKRIEEVTGDPADVVLDGGGQSRMMHVMRGSNITIANITFQGGYGFWAPGALAIVMSDANLHCDVFQHNTAFDEGGAVGAADSALNIVGSTFLSNHSGYECGALDFFGLVDHHDTLTISGSSFVDNTAGNGGGAAITAWNDDRNVDVYIQDSSFIGNSTTGFGGAVQTWGAGSSLTMRDSFVGWNGAGEGGGLFLYDRDMAAMIWIEGSQFVDNMAGGAASAIMAGGTCSDTHIIDSVIAHNQTTTGSTTQAAVYATPGPLQSFDTDWGFGSRDNEAVDFYGPCGFVDDLGPHETFTCNADGTME